MLDPSAPVVLALSGKLVSTETDLEVPLTPFVAVYALGLYRHRSTARTFWFGGFKASTQNLSELTKVGADH